MSEKAIFVTGGASGIGLAVAQLFSARGWRVGLGDINAAGLELARATLPPGQVTTHPMDVRDPAQWRAALDAFATASGGRLDAMLNNAGIALSGPLALASEEEVERIVGINLLGVIHGARAACPLLRASGGALVNTASAAALYGAGGMALYAATKFGVRGLSEALDAEWARDGVKVCVLMPSFIDTPLLDAAVSGSNRTAREAVQAARLEFTPLDTVAEAVWGAVHGDTLHVVVGKTARKLAFAARWMPSALRKQLRAKGALR